MLNSSVQCSKTHVEFNRKHLSMGNFQENVRDISKGNLGNQAILHFTNLEKLLLVLVSSVFARAV